MGKRIRYTKKKIANRKPLKWSNLKENRCPECGKDWLQMGNAKFEYAMIQCKCGFKISEKRMQEIVTDKVNLDIRENGGASEILMLIVTIVLTLALAGGIFYALKMATNSLSDNCKADCEDSDGKYVRYMLGHYSPDQCICKIDGEVKNIW